ncbi:carbamoyltransferase N-terminal domain-containing protein [Thermomonospora echinospora]|uniref:carbamoyltransferase N-terminal domain-containing protein n=1 Tax=Thermomonospora echinospora TaxID=1992 RepID=UPI00190E8F62
MLHLVRRAGLLTGARTLCIGGGAAMNCASIGGIVEQAGFEEVFVPLAPDDSGTAPGSLRRGRPAPRGDQRAVLPWPRLSRHHAAQTFSARVDRRPDR